MAIGLLIGFIAVVLITLAWATTQPSGAADELTCPPGSKPAGVGCIDKHPVSITLCSAKRAVKFYAGRIAYWHDKMGAGNPARAAGSRSEGSQRPSPRACPRYLAHVLQRKAYALRKAYPAWIKRVWEYQYAWWKWLPDKFARVGACETGYGKKPGSWTWDSGTYVSAFGIYRPAYEAYHHWTGHNTPREQYEVAAAIQARFGWGAWGCGGS